MSIEYDEKGKFYTEVVTKLPTSALIQTATHQVRGLIHIRQGERLKGELERDERFLAVTRATIHDAEGKVIFEAPFLAIQRTQIIWVLPLEDQSGDESQ
ncbi:MAG: hypothetical protein Fur002_06800 [Anaerolineales bacterium]